MPKLINMGKTYVHTNEEINKHIEQVLFKAIAKQIYESKDFQESLRSEKLNTTTIIGGSE